MLYILLWFRLVRVKIFIIVFLFLLTFPATGVLHSAEVEKPRIALIFDDFGYPVPSSSIFQGFCSIDCPIAVSIIPGLRYSTETAEIFFRAGKEVLIHLPMEAEEYTEIDPICLMTNMSFDSIRGLFYQAMVDIPCCAGISNHQGSFFCSDSAAVSRFMRVLRETELYCVDNLTSPESLIFRQCNYFGIPALRRDVFIDTNLENGETSADRFNQLVRIAKFRGFAIGVGHRYGKTLKALQVFLASPQASEVEIVFPSEFLP